MQNRRNRIAAQTRMSGKSRARADRIDQPPPAKAAGKKGTPPAFPGDVKVAPPPGIAPTRTRRRTKASPKKRRAAAPPQTATALAATALPAEFIAQSVKTALTAKAEPAKLPAASTPAPLAPAPVVPVAPAPVMTLPPRPEPLVAPTPAADLPRNHAMTRPAPNLITAITRWLHSASRLLPRKRRAALPKPPRRLPRQQPVVSPDPIDELARLRAENDQLRAQLEALAKASQPA